MTLFDTGALLLTVLCVFCQQTGGTTSILVTAEGCLYENNGIFKLHCGDHQYIDMLYAILGRSPGQCRNNRTCCPSTNICYGFASQNLIKQQKRSCYGKQECQITVVRNKCKLLSEMYETDYESVTYLCYNNSMAVTTAQTAATTATMTTNAASGHIPHNTDSKASTANSQANIALIVGLTTVAGVVVIAAVLVVLVYRRRKRRPANHPAQDNHSTWPETNLNKTTDSNKSEPEANPYDTIPEDTATHPPGDTHVYYNSGQIVMPPVAENVYCNEQPGAIGAKKKPQNNVLTLPDVALDELHIKPNKQSTPQNVSQYIYSEVKRRNTDQQVDSRETPGDSDIVMVRNELYN